ncbi:MAG: N-acetylmuramoyl-L-alanine amidase [Clostridia bacterium]|nr:N-acetylmuramoyl-L-alanine amidase [Clostridia bacterium]
MAIRIYVDQGHNPRDYNTGAEAGGVFEQDITYNIGILLNDLLSRNSNFITKLSRPTEDTMLGTSNSTSLSARVNEAKEFGADLFLSLHVNSAESTRASGNEALVYGSLSTVAEGIGTAILEQLTLTTGLRNRGIVYRPGLYILRETPMPAVLVEMGFISNPYDRELLTEEPELFALGIYRGLLDYYNLG